MKFEIYSTVQAFGADVLDTLMLSEAQNNLPISFITGGPERDTSDWLMCSVKDGAGKIALVAACTPPYNIVLFEPENRPNSEAAALLSRELKALGCALPGVLAEKGLARRFAAEYAGEGAFETKISLVIMQLDAPPASAGAAGHLREITREDLIFLPYWAREFGRDCGIEHYEIAEHHRRLEPRVGAGEFFVWHDGTPVAMTAIGRRLVNGAVINYVYTPSFLRGRGYGRAVVSGVCREIFERGNRFAALFADTNNPVSCGLYRSLGFKDICVYDELKFAPLMR